jgi:hypothetical protein
LFFMRKHVAVLRIRILKSVPSVLF